MACACRALFVAALAAACGSETGLIVEVTREDAPLLSAIDKLTFFVGVKQPEGMFVKDEPSSMADVALQDRDLKAEPYRLLLRDGTNGSAPAQVKVAVLAFANGQEVGFGTLEPPQAFVPGAMILRTVVIRTDGLPVLKDTGCLEWHQDGDRVWIGSDVDMDCDGVSRERDCADTDPSRHPSAPELCGNDLDDDCDEKVDENEDLDQDGVFTCDGDCDDGDAKVNPNQVEICDGKDNDCSGGCDESFDVDGDEVTTCGTKPSDGATCEPALAPDCDDHDPVVNPGQSEVCDGKDNDCNGICDDDPELDKDGDKFTTCYTMVGVCETILPYTDCDDENADIHPYARESCDGVDSDCDGAKSWQQPCYRTDLVADVCEIGSATCDDDSSDGSSGLGTCVPTADPVVVSPELCAAYDQCKLSSDPNPFECANDASTRRMLCLLRVAPDGRLCPERKAPLPTTTATQCTWVVEGGTMQRHYIVGLSNGGSAPGPVLASCEGSFHVLDKRDLIPQEDYVVLTFTDQSSSVEKSEVVPVTIRPTRVFSCSSEPGLVCTVTASP